MTQKILRIKGYQDKKYVSVPGTKPPRITDLKMHVNPFIPFESVLVDRSPFNLKLVYDRKDFRRRTPPDGYYVEATDIDRCTTNNFYMHENDKPFHLQDKSDLIYKLYKEELYNPDLPDEDQIPNSIINARLTITPINGNGAGPTSSFILPVRGLVGIDHRDLNQYPVTFFLNKYWNLFTPFPDDKYKQSKTMFIYLDVPEEVVESDKEKLLQPEWRVTTPHNNWKEISFNNYRWVINDQNQYTKLSADGWSFMTPDEIEFISTIIKVLSPLYKQELAIKKKDFNDPHVVKFLVPHPKDESDSIYIYIMKSSPWKL